MEDGNTPNIFIIAEDLSEKPMERSENDLKQFQEGVSRKKNQKESCMKSRYLVLVMGFFGEFFTFYPRTTMSVGLIAMVNNSYIPSEIESSESCVNLLENNNGSKYAEEHFQQMTGEFEWSDKLQGYILGCSYISCTVALPVLSKFCEIYGGKIILLYGIFFSSLFTFLTPFAANWNVYVLIACQSLRGLSQGGLIPAVAVLLANWFPKQERGFSYTLMICGAPFGAVLGSYFTGVLCEMSFLKGWPSAFFIAGCTGFVVSVIILFFLYDNPSVHPTISPAELQYILTNQENVLTKKRPKTPWRSIVTSIPVHALGYAYFGQVWASSHFLSANPIFLKRILHYSVEQDGLFNSIPFVLQIISSQIAAFLSSLSSKNNYISIDKARKFWTLLSVLGYSICVLGIYFAECNRFLAVFFTVAASAFSGFSYAGCWIVTTDMSPTFTASIETITYTFGTLPTFILPVMIGYLTNGSQTIEQWNKIFFISIAVVLSSGVVFVVFGSAEIQPWNNVSAENSQEMKEKVIKIPENTNFSTEGEKKIQEIEGRYL